LNSILVAGTRVVILALISYSIAIITEQRKQLVTRTVLIFITLGIILDIVATLFMILGTSNTPFTLHGILGYSSLTAMLIDAALLWRHQVKFSSSTKVPNSLHLYSRLAYIWWILAFITGALLVFLK